MSVWPFSLYLSTGNYRSFAAPFEWKDVPMFCVLSGENGSGKTQILEMINDTSMSQSGKRGWEVSCHKRLAPGDILYSAGQLPLKVAPAIGQDHVATALSDISGTLVQTQSGAYNDSPRRIRRMVADKLGRSLDQLSARELQSLLPDNALIQHVPTPEPLSAGLASCFYRYWLRYLDELTADHKKADHRSQQQIQKEIGIPPWEIVNDLLSRAHFPHEVATPDGYSAAQHYQFGFRNAQGEFVPQEQLSSGEKSMLTLAYLLYHSDELRVLPRLLLLDEPDAHLHPGIVDDYFRAIREVLVDRHGVRVIMTTHRLDTIALVPKQGELFLVSRSEPRIQRAASKNAVVARLSANALAVLPNARCVFVEDSHDVEFYSSVRSILVRHERFVATSMLSFQSSNLGKGGGKDAARTLVQRLSDAKLAPLVVALIDHDTDNKTGDGVYRIDRYCHENFLVDPILIHAALADKGDAPEVSLVRDWPTSEGDRETKHEPGPQIDEPMPEPETVTYKFGPGDVHKLRTARQEVLQAIADQITGRLGAVAGNTDIKTFPVSYAGVDGVRLMLPTWLRDKKGKWLMMKAREEFGVDRKELLQSLRRLQFVPVELADMFLKMTEPLDEEEGPDGP